MIHRPHFTGYGVKPHVDQRPTLSKAVSRVNWYQSITGTHFAPCRRFLCFSEHRNRDEGAARSAREHEGFGGLQWFDDFEGEAFTLEMHPSDIYSSASNTSPFSVNLTLNDTKAEILKRRSGGAFRLTETPSKLFRAKNNGQGG